MHTAAYSPDAAQTIEELVCSAKALGIKKLSITEHYDMDYPHKDEIFTFDIEDYYRNFPRWREISASCGGPNLLMGIEIGWQPHLNERIAQTVASAPFDTVLLSAHTFRGLDVFYSTEVAHIPRKERNREYISNLARMCRETADYDILAHYDYINRYVTDPKSSVFYSDCPKEFDELFEVLISRDKALEINTSSIDKQISKNAEFILPDPEVIRRYIAMGGKLITIGSDAHKSENIGIHFDRTAKYLKSLGVHELFYYEGRKPQSDPEFAKYF